jgi:hypothetical protein
MSSMSQVASTIYLRVAKESLDPVFSLTQSTSASDQTSQYHPYVLQGSLEEIHPYSDGKVDWLKKIARLLFSPKAPGAGSKLLTFKNGTTGDWLMKEMTQADWEPVDDGEPLRDTIYEFRASTPTLCLAQISRRVLDPQAYEFDKGVDEYEAYIRSAVEDHKDEDQDKVEGGGESRRS